MDEEQSKRLLLQLEAGRRQLEQLSRQSQFVASAITELDSALEALKALSEQGMGARMYVPVGAGTYVEASLGDTSTVLVGVGANISAERRLPDAVGILEERRKKLVESNAAIQKTMGELAVKVSELQERAEEMLSQGR